MRTRGQKRIGEIFENKRGEKFIIIDFINKTSVVVSSISYNYVKVVTSKDISKGNVKTPFSKTVCDIGYIGLTKQGKRPQISVEGKATREYKLWQNMIDRCYSGKFDSYKYVTVCERWLCFANFLEDLPLIDGYTYWLNETETRVSLDKDIKQPNTKNKIYSLETCVFISASENTKESTVRTRQCGLYAINKETKEITFFESVSEVKKLWGISTSGINKCLYSQGKGTKRKTSHGYYWVEKSKMENFLCENPEYVLD